MNTRKALRILDLLASGDQQTLTNIMQELGATLPVAPSIERLSEDLEELVAQGFVTHSNHRSSLTDPAVLRAMQGFYQITTKGHQELGRLTTSPVTA